MGLDLCKERKFKKFCVEVYYDGITQRHNVGHEADGVLDQDVETWFDNSTSTSASDGSSSVTLETGGEKDSTHRFWHNNRNDWTETRRTGPASAPGGTTGSVGSLIGFGPTQTTSGTSSGQWSTETTNHSEWKQTQSFTTPAVFGGVIVFGGGQTSSSTASGQPGSLEDVENGDADASDDTGGDTGGGDTGTSARSLDDGDSSDSDWSSDGSREGWDPGVFAYFAPGTGLGGGGLSPIDEPPSAGDDIPTDDCDGLPIGGAGGPLQPPDDVSEPVILRIPQGSQFIGRLPDGAPIPLLEGDQDARIRQLERLLRDNDATASQTEALVSLFSGLDVIEQSRLMAQLQSSANRQNQAVPIRPATPDEVLRREQEQQHLQKLDLKTKRYEYLGDNRFRAPGSRVILVVDPITDRILAHDDSDAQRGRITPLRELPAESSYFRPPKEPSSFAGAQEWQDYQDELNRETWRAGNAFNLRIDAVFGILGAGVALGKLRTILTPSEQAEFDRLRTLHPEWMPQAGLDSVVEVRTVKENRDARNKVSGNGHHPHPLKFSGDPNPQQLVVTGETRTQKNPIHREVSNFWNSLLKRLRSEGVAK